MPPAPSINGSTINAAARRKALQCPECLSFAASCRERQPLHVKQQRRIGSIEHTARARRHGADRVAMISVLQRQDAAPGLAPVAPETQRHLERDLHRGRTAIRIEDMRKTRGRHRKQCLRHILGGLVGEAGEDHLIQRVGLSFDSGHDAGMTMAVSDHPPRRDRIQNGLTLCGFQPCPLAARNQRRRIRQGMLCERVPDGRRHAKS